MDKILIVEDEIALSKAVAKGLTKENFSVREIADGRVALDHLLHHHDEYAVVLLDIMLPNIDGISILKQLRFKSINVKVILLTALGELDDKIIGYETGADDYVVKPFEFKELIMRIKALMRRNETIESDIVNIDKVSVNLASYEVTENGKIVPLTKTEFDILAYLLKNRGTVRSRESIIDHIWGDEEYPLEKVIDSHIKNIRHKFYDASFIQAVRGVGYKIS